MTASFTQDQTKLEVDFSTKFAASGISSIPVDYLGIKREPQNGELIKFRVKRVPSATYKIGGGRRNFGSVLINIQTPSGVGAARLFQIVDTIKEFYHIDGRPIRLGALLTRTASLMGPEEDGALLLATIDVPFHSDYSD